MRFICKCPIGCSHIGALILIFDLSDGSLSRGLNQIVMMSKGEWLSTMLDMCKYKKGKQNSPHPINAQNSFLYMVIWVNHKYLFLSV